MLYKINRIHFIGIGGYGMSALARVCLDNGYKVTGSDINPSSLTSTLEQNGAVINYFHSKENIKNVDLVVYSTAIKEDNEEVQEAKNKSIPLWHRSELLARLFNEGFGIAVAGAHGKTTTTSMVSLILSEAGLDPTALIGGEFSYFNGNARAGEGKEIVAEACESDHSFLRYKANIAVITNIEADHLEYYEGDFNKLLSTYKEFLNNLKPGGRVIANVDCPHMEKVVDRSCHNVVLFGKSNRAGIRIYDIKLLKGGSKFKLKHEKELGELHINAPGEHNVFNAAAACAVALELGIEFSAVKKALAKFKGAKRRFTVVDKIEGITIVDDYAHHPTEIEATLKTAKNECEGDVIAVFQPHRYSRTKYFMEDFSKAFEYADEVILHQVFGAGEAPLAGVSSFVLGEKIKERSREFPSKVVVMEEFEHIIKYLVDTANPLDYVITMGAGNINEVAYGLRDKLTGVKNS